MSRPPLALCLSTLLLVSCSKPADVAPAPANDTPLLPAAGDFGRGIVPPDPPKLGSMSFPPSNWIFADVVSYLGTTKGVKVEMVSAAQFDNPERPAAIFRTGSDADGSLATVLVYRCKDAPSARSTALTMGDHAFSKGLFAFGPMSPNAETVGLLASIGSKLSP